VRLLVVGASGHLGGEVCRRATAAGWEVVGTFHRGPTEIPGVRWAGLDIADRAAVAALVAATRPDAVVGTAYVPGEWVVCADGPANLAVAAARHGARLVHVSTDAVHGGRPEPYGDAEPPTPVSAYGAAKAAAETAVRAVDPGAAVVRCSLILGDERSEQVRRCLDLCTGRATGALFTDEIRCPVGVEDLAAAVLELVTSDHSGPINVAGPQALSRAELGALVARRYGLDPARVPVSTVAEAGLPPRPVVLRLDIGLARTLLKTRLRPASEVLAPDR
jgi:dTDP-4-dehydrorhamnose reductase